MAKNLTTFVIADLLSVDPGSVANWIDQDRLRAYRTPGGHRRVRVEDLLEFLRKQKMPIPPELQTKPPCVIVVDDEIAVAQVIAKALKKANPQWEVLEANDGFQAGAMVSTKRPEVVILDLRMPGMDGFEVCQRLKADPETRNVAVLAITAYPSQENHDRILQCGAKACFAKPLDLPALIGKVAACITS